MLEPLMIGIVTLNTSMSIFFWTFLLGDSYFKFMDKSKTETVSLGRRGQEEGPYFVDYVPPARDAVALPCHVVYVLVGVVLVVVATYAIVGHLIKDLMHDLADWILGPKPVEVDSERGTEGEVEKHQGSVYDEATQAEEGRMEIEEEGAGLLPGYWPRPPAPPLPSAMSALPGENRASHLTVCPLTPYVTSV